MDYKQHDRYVSSSRVLLSHCLQLLFLFHPAGAGGGLVASIATCPLDVVKTKLQAQRAVQGQIGYEGIAGASCRLLYHLSGSINVTLLLSDRKIDSKV